MSALNLVGFDFSGDIDEMRRIFSDVTGDNISLRIMLNELDDAVTRKLGYDYIFKVFCEILDKWIDGKYGDCVDGEVEPIEAGVYGCGEVSKLFDDDWNAIEGFVDEYVWGWDGGGFINYDR